MQPLAGCCRTSMQGNIIPEIVHNALLIPAMPSTVRQARADLMMEIQLSCLDLDNRNYFVFRKSRISMFIIHRPQISRPSGNSQCHLLSQQQLLGPDWSLSHETVTDTELFTVGAGTTWFGSRSITGQSQILTHLRLLLLLQETIELTIPTCATFFFSEVTWWSRAAKKGTLTVAHIFPHWSMRTLHNNVGQWFGPPPPPPPSEHEKSLCFPSSFIARRNLFSF